MKPLTPLHEHALHAARAQLAEANGAKAQAAGSTPRRASAGTVSGNVHERGHALLGQARCLAGRSRSDAERALGEAREIFASLRAQPLLAEIDALLRDASPLVVTSTGTTEACEPRVEVSRSVTAFSALSEIWYWNWYRSQRTFCAPRATEAGPDPASVHHWTSLSDPSKPVRSGSPRLGRFDSCAAPLRNLCRPPTLRPAGCLPSPATGGEVRNDRTEGPRPTTGDYGC